VDPTQPNPPKTEKSRPNPWVNPTHGQLWSVESVLKRKKGYRGKDLWKKRFQACSERVAGVMDDESGKSMKEVLVKASYNLRD